MKKDNPEDNNFNVDLTSVKESAKYRQAEAARKQAEAKQMTRWEKVKAFFGNERTRLAMGVALMLFAAYLCLSFLSFFFTAGASDQNRVVNYTVMENAHSPLSIKNAGKAVGASLANFFISDGVVGCADNSVVAVCDRAAVGTQEKIIFLFIFADVAVQHIHMLHDCWGMHTGFRPDVLSARG